MKILVLSDSHGAQGSLYDVLDANSGAKYVFFLGDGLRDLEEIEHSFKDKFFYKVQGNCDMFSFFPSCTSTVLEGKKILFTHGHLHSVKQSLLSLKEAAKQHNADICLFGHTHTPFYEFCDGCLFLNPGSINKNKANKSTYAVIEITKDKIIPKIIEI